MAIVAYAGLNLTYATVGSNPSYSTSASDGATATLSPGATSTVAAAAFTVNGKATTEYWITFRIKVTANSLAAGGYRTVAFTDNASTHTSTSYGSTAFKIRFYQNGNVTVLFNAAESPVLSTWTLNTYQTWGLNLRTDGYSLYRDGVLQGSVSVSTGIGSVIFTRCAVGQLGDGSGTGSLTLVTNTIASVSNIGGSRTTWYDYDNDIPVIIMPLWSLAESSDTTASTSAIRSSLMGPPFSGGIYARSQTPDANLKLSSYYAAYCAEGFETIVLAASAGGPENVSSGNIYFGHRSSGNISYNAAGLSTSVTIPYLKEPSVNRNVGETIYASYTLAAASASYLTMGGVGFYRERPLVQAKLWMVDDNAASTDRYLAAFFSEGTAVTQSGRISSVQLKVTKASDGSLLFGPSAMTAIDTGLYKLDATGTSRIADGAGYIATLTAIVDGRNFTWYQPVSRDS